jgi:4-alpha-glucanotransferase
MITKKLWKDFERLRSETYNLQSKIESHIGDVLRAAFEIYGSKLDTWYYPGAPEGGMGELEYDADSISVVTEPKRGGYIDIRYFGRTHKGCDYDISCDFPLELLFVSLDEAKERIEFDKKQIEEKEAEKKRKAKERRQAREAKKKKLKESAAGKLTPQERKAVGL